MDSEATESRMRSLSKKRRPSEKSDWVTPAAEEEGGGADEFEGNVEDVTDIEEKKDDEDYVKAEAKPRAVEEIADGSADEIIGRKSSTRRNHSINGIKTNCSERSVQTEDDEDFMDANIHTGHRIILDFAPSMLVKIVQQDGSEVSIRNPPFKTELTGVVMFLDLSGFTMLTEKLSERGDAGSETLGFYLNRYFERLAKMIGRSGGDIFKFAGDAMIVVWHSSLKRSCDSADLARLAREATQCSLHIQEELNGAELAEDVKFSVKVGVGAGSMAVLHVGGEKARIEYVLCGTPLLEAFECESLCAAGETIVSRTAWELMQDKFEGETVGTQGAMKILKNLKRVKHVSIKRPSISSNLAIHLLQRYVPAAIKPYMTCHPSWLGEIRQVSVLFINLGIDPHQLVDVDEHALRLVQTRFELVQRETYRLEGSVNKFLLDDKGSTVLVVFGLPPVSHANDPARAAQLALTVSGELRKLNADLPIYTGVTSGSAFCGPIGSGTRREYSVLGDIVNTSARFMQAAKALSQSLTKGPGFCGDIICDNSTYTQACDMLEIQFVELPPIHLKGKKSTVKAFQPGWVHTYADMETRHQERFLLPSTTSIEDSDENVISTQARPQVSFVERSHLEMLFAFDNFLYSRGQFPSTVLHLGPPNSGKTQAIDLFTKALQEEYIATRVHVIGSSVKCYALKMHSNAKVDTTLAPVQIIRVTALFSRGTHHGAYVWGQIILAMNYIAKRANLAGADPMLLHASVFSVSWLPRSVLHGSGETAVGMSQFQQFSNGIISLIKQIRDHVGTIALVIDDAQWMSALDWKLTRSISGEFESQGEEQLPPNGPDPGLGKKANAKSSSPTFAGFFMLVAAWPSYSLPYEPVFQVPNVDFLEMVHSINKTMTCTNKLSLLDTEQMILDMFGADVVDDKLLQSIWRMTEGCSVLTRNCIQELRKRACIKSKKARCSEPTDNECYAVDGPHGAKTFPSPPGTRRSSDLELSGREERSYQMSVQISRRVLKDGLTSEAFLEACRTPHSSRLIAGIVDKLSAGDQVLLKCASVLCRGSGIFGSSFDLGMLMSIFPMKEIQSTSSYFVSFSMEVEAPADEAATATPPEVFTRVQYTKEDIVRGHSGQESSTHSHSSSGWASGKRFFGSLLGSGKLNKDSTPVSQQPESSPSAYFIPELMVEETAFKAFIKRVERLQRYGLIEAIPRPSPTDSDLDEKLHAGDFCLPVYPVLQQDKFALEEDSRPSHKRHHTIFSHCFRFTSLVARDVVYNRSTLAQRRRLHLSSVQTLQEIIKHESLGAAARAEQKRSILHQMALASCIHHYFQARNYVQAKELFERHAPCPRWFHFNYDDITALASARGAVLHEEVEELKRRRSRSMKQRNSRLWSNIRKPSRNALILPDINSPVSPGSKLLSSQGRLGALIPGFSFQERDDNPQSARRMSASFRRSSNSDSSTGSSSADSSSHSIFDAKAPRRLSIMVRGFVSEKLLQKKPIKTITEKAMHETLSEIDSIATRKPFRRSQTLQHSFKVKRRFSLTDQDGWWRDLVNHDNKRTGVLGHFINILRRPFASCFPTALKEDPQGTQLKKQGTLSFFPSGDDGKEFVRFPSLRAFVDGESNLSSAVQPQTGSNKRLVDLLYRMGSSLENLGLMPEQEPENGSSSGSGKKAIAMLSSTVSSAISANKILNLHKGKVKPKASPITNFSSAVSNATAVNKLIKGRKKNEQDGIAKDNPTPPASRNGKNSFSSEQHHLFVYAAFETLERLFVRYRDKNIGKELTRITYKLDAWDFDVFEFERFSKGMPLFSILRLVFVKYDFLSSFRISQQQLNAFAQKAESGYPANPYHNSLHAADVVQAVHVLLQTIGDSPSAGTASFSSLNYISIFLAAALHDIRHPGVTNAFLVATKSQIALEYDSPQLENYHVSMAKPLLFHLLSGDSVTKRNKIIENVTQLILATAIQNHEPFLRRINMRFMSHHVSENQLDNSQDRIEMLSLVIVCADLSNCARNLELHKKWVIRITDEFLSQGDIELKAGLPVSPFMDKFESKMQLNFIDKVARPSFMTLMNIYPSTAFFFNLVQENYFFWKHANRGKQNLRTRHMMRGSTDQVSMENILGIEASSANSFRSGSSKGSGISLFHRSGSTQN